MRLLRRNTTKFLYRAYAGQEEVLEDGLHTGRFEPAYLTGVQYRGTINRPEGFSTDNLFGINTNYTHILLMDKPNTLIEETGLIDWNGNTYEIVAVRKSINVLSVGLRQRTKNHADQTSGDQNENHCVCS